MPTMKNRIEVTIVTVQRLVTMAWTCCPRVQICRRAAGLLA